MIYLANDEAVWVAREVLAWVLLEGLAQRAVEIRGRASGRPVCRLADRQPVAAREAGPDARAWVDVVARTAL
jgi:hypothetical protein